jgi:ammonia channel protein AmtB
VASASVSFIRSLVAYAAEHRFKNKTWPDIVFFRYDLLEVGLVHAASGFIGMFLTGVFNR